MFLNNHNNGRLSKCLPVALLTVKVILDVIPALFHSLEYLRIRLYLKNGKGLFPSKEKLSIQSHWSVNSTSKNNVSRKPTGNTALGV
jgi:hypothetical protein